MDYQRWWRDRRGLADFGRRLCDAWTSAYLAASGADLAELVLVDPGNGFRYLFDLAGSLSGATPDGHAPRAGGRVGAVSARRLRAGSQPDARAPSSRPGCR